MWTPSRRWGWTMSPAYGPHGQFQYSCDHNAAAGICARDEIAGIQHSSSFLLCAQSEAMEACGNPKQSHATLLRTQLAQDIMRLCQAAAAARRSECQQLLVSINGFLLPTTPRESRKYHQACYNASSKLRAAVMCASQPSQAHTGLL